jgi:hypothetical protein
VIAVIGFLCLAFHFGLNAAIERRYESLRNQAPHLTVVNTRGRCADGRVTMRIGVAI